MTPLPGIGFQEVRRNCRSSFKDFSITIDPDAFGMSRDELARALTAENIDTRKYYDPPVHRQTAYRGWAPPAGTLPHTERLAERILSIPVWSHMDEATARGVCQAIGRVHDFAKDIVTAIAG